MLDSILYDFMAKIVSDSLIPSAPNAPLDKRTEVNTMAEAMAVENPSESLIIYVKETKKHYKITEMIEETIPGTTLKHKVIGSLEPIGEGDVSYEELGDVDLDGVIDQTDVTYTELGDVPSVDFDSLS